MAGDNGNNRNNGRLAGHPDGMWSSEPASDAGLPPSRPHLHRSLDISYGDYTDIHNEAHARLTQALESNAIDNDAFREASRALDQQGKVGI